MLLLQILKKHLFTLFAATFILWGLSAHYWITTQTVNADDLSSMIYFLPEHKQMVLDKQHEMIANAKKSIDVAAFGFTVGNPMIDELVSACKRGVKVRLYRDRGQSTQKLSALANSQIRAACGKNSVRLKKITQPIMHSKYIITDNVDVMWGSYNFSKSGPSQDNVVETNNNGEIFESNFNMIWATGVVR